MIRRALTLAALPVAVWALHPSPAWPDQGVYITDPGEDDGSIAWLIHDNQERTGAPLVSPFSVEIDGRGAITGTVDNTRNIYCTPACPDTVVILDVPEGLAVVPPGVTTAEGSQSVLRVYEAVGM